MSCNHAALLQLASNDSLSLCDTGRLDQVCRMLPDPVRQKPSLIFFPGAGSKDHALSYLFRPERLKKGAREGGNSLRIDRSTMDSDNPILILESDLEAPPPRPLQYVNCHENQAHKIVWHPPPSDCLWLSLHARLLFPFADVICIFANDFGGLEGVVRYLRRCSKYSFASSAPWQIRPRVLIVCSSRDESPTLHLLEIEELRYGLLQEGGPDLQECFSEISVLDLPGDHTSPMVKYRSLVQSLLKHAQQMRQIRTKNSYLFTAAHLSAFFSKAVAHVSRSARQPFNFIQESRQKIPPSPDFQDHLARFLGLAAKLKVPYDAIASFAASAAMLDAYPPGMHGKQITLAFLP